ncbi:MAG: V-type ATP synthase subunit D [Thermoplasmata archaeon]
METSNIRPTRMELLKTKARIRLARRGLELLKLKRSSLIMEFFKIAKDVKGMKADLSKSIKTAMESERLSEIIAGGIVIENAAYMQPNLIVGVSSKNVMGVKIPEVNIRKSETFLNELYETVSLPTSLMETRKYFISLMDSILTIAEKEISMRKLLIEIDKTKRRTNSIENVLIPRLVDTSNYIKMRLDEMDREIFITLKMIKGKMEEREEVEVE